MDIEATIFDRLTTSEALHELTGGVDGSFSSGFSSGFDVAQPGRIFPVTATENAQVPFVVFSCLDNGPELTLNGPIGISTFTVTVDSYAIDFDEVRAMATAVKDVLHGWRTNSVMLSRLSTAGAEPMEVGHHYSQTFNVIMKDTNA